MHDLHRQWIGFKFAQANFQSALFNFIGHLVRKYTGQSEAENRRLNRSVIGCGHECGFQPYRHPVVDVAKPPILHRIHLHSCNGNTPCKQTGLKVEFSTKEEESSAMKQSRFTDSQIMAILKQVENGLAVPDVCREHGISVPTFYKWRAKFGGMDASLIARMKELEAENARLKKMYIETQIKNDLLSEALGKKP